MAFADSTFGDCAVGTPVVGGVPRYTVTALIMVTAKNTVATPRCAVTRAGYQPEASKPTYTVSMPRVAWAATRTRERMESARTGRHARYREKTRTKRARTRNPSAHPANRWVSSIAASSGAEAGPQSITFGHANPEFVAVTYPPITMTTHAPTAEARARPFNRRTVSRPGVRRGRAALPSADDHVVEEGELAESEYARTDR